jgi:hypothetical protein
MIVDSLILFLAGAWPVIHLFCALAVHASNTAMIVIIVVFTELFEKKHLMRLRNSYICKLACFGLVPIGRQN